MATMFSNEFTVKNKTNLFRQMFAILDECGHSLKGLYGFKLTKRFLLMPYRTHYAKSLHHALWKQSSPWLCEAHCDCDTVQYIVILTVDSGCASFRIILDLYR